MKATLLLMPHGDISKEQGPFVLKGFDTFDNVWYDMHPVNKHTYDTHDEALAGAAIKAEAISETQPDSDLRDQLAIVAISGNIELYLN